LWVSAAAIALVVLLVLPVTVGLAQRLLERRARLEVQPVRFNVEARLNLVRNALPVTYDLLPSPLRPVSDLAEAGRFAGFVPVRPAGFTWKTLVGLMFRDPIEAPFQIMHWRNQSLKLSRVSVRGPVNGVIRIRAAALDAALRQVGVNDFTVPQSWDGAEIGIEFSPTVISDYGIAQLAQSLPYTIVWPDSFPVGDFWEALLRILGMTPADAQRMRNSFAEHPALLTLLSPEATLEVTETPMGMGPLRESWKGMLVRNTSTRAPACDFCPGPSEQILIWNTPDGVYALKGPLKAAGLITLAHSLAATVK
jgi:hypothetical protein